MKSLIVLDSTPLALLVHRRGFKPAEECRTWVAIHMAAGRRVLVPEIVDYEVRRELLRMGKSRAITLLDGFLQVVPGRVIPITSAAIRLAAKLWAESWRRGTPTADRHALDVDVILAAQVLAYGLQPTDFVVATSNVSHLAQFVPAEEWTRI